MSRNKKEANTKIFASLDNHCAERGDSVRNAGIARWIATQTKEQKFLTNATKILSLQFSSTKRIVFYRHLAISYFFTIGFQQASPFSNLEETALSAGMLTALLADETPKPVASILEIRNIVEAQDKNSTDYVGHDAESIRSFFPKIFAYQGGDVSESEAYRVFFRLCLAECAHGDYWLDQNLIDALNEMCDLDSLRIPYQTLCRSIFDADPAALFLALYRCIEAIYALKTAKSLVEDLGIKLEWSEVTTILESKLGWRPPEASSLNALLAHAREIDLKLILSSLNQALDANSVLSDYTGSHVYKLRNAMVHYRPIHHRVEYSTIDWSGLCIAMARLVSAIYENLFETVQND